MLLLVTAKPTERNDDMTGTTLTRIRRRRLVRAVELALLGAVMSLLALSLERSHSARAGAPLGASLR